MSIPPPAERPAYPRAGWLVAAIAGALCGIVFLFLRAPQPEVQATPDAGPLPVLVELPDAEAPNVDAGGEIADAAAVAELPDAGAPGDVLDAAADAAGPGASSTDGGAKGAGSGKTAKGAGKQIIRGSKHNYWMDDDGYIHRLDPPPPPGPAKPAAAPAEPPAAPPKASAAPAQPPPAPTPTFVLPFGRVED